MKPRLLALAASIALSVLAQAPSFTGRWLAEASTPWEEKRQITFFLTQKGDSLTGAVLTSFRMRTMTEGKVNGDKASWIIETRSNNQERRLEYDATFAGDHLEINMPDSGSNENRRNIVAKKISPDGTPIYPFANLPKVALPAIHPLPDNGLARTPPMGWNSWNKFRGKVDDKIVREIADAIVSSGMKDAGYVYVNIDDTWEGVRDASGNIQTNEKFPDMRKLADYVHSKGLKLGIYSSPGPRTCANYEGSYGHENQDAKTWAAWAIDYLKYDWCSASEVFKPTDMEPVYQRMGEALRASGRPIVFSLCQYGLEHVEKWGPDVGGNLWRSTGDISDNWKSMSEIGFERQSELTAYARPGHWNDPDMLEVGNGGMSETEYRTHMSLWSILAAPLLAGNDLRDMSSATREILCNREVIAIDQDNAGHQGYRVSKDGDKEVWGKPLENGDWAVALFNRGQTTVTITANLNDLKLSGKHRVRDLWQHKGRGPVESAFSDEVPAHGVVLIRIAGQPEGT